MENIYEASYKIRSYEIDPKGKAQLYTLLNYFQDAAGEHAAELGVSITDLFAKRMTWVLSRYHIKILRYPLWGEAVKVVTWPSGSRGLFALRDQPVGIKAGKRPFRQALEGPMGDRRKGYPQVAAQGLETRTGNRNNNVITRRCPLLLRFQGV